MSEPLLKIPNPHAVAIGDPPIVDGSDQNPYIGYFENGHGEQWIFTRDRKTGTAPSEAATSAGTPQLTSPTAHQRTGY
jgi:hypothetical protein